MKIRATVMICNNRFIMRTVEQADAETLRLWKNDHKEFFFYKKEITYDEQQLWYKSISNKNDDHMFIIFDNQKPIGCIGARLFKDCIDVYNVILGNKDYKGMHVMTEALWAVVSFSTFIYKDTPIQVRVLSTNHAIKWYEKLGFKMSGSYEDHVVMMFNKATMKPPYNFKIDITV